MFLTEKKLYARLRELDEYRYRDRIPFKELRTLEDEGSGVNPDLPEISGDWGIIHHGDTWTGRDRYLWLSVDAEFPAEWAGKRVLGRFDFGTTGGGTNSGFESMLYLDGQPYQGVDSNHKEVFFAGVDVAGGSKRLLFRLWSGLEGGGKPREQKHEIKLAEICWLDEAADDLYYTGLTVYQTIQVLDEQDAERALLQKTMDRAFRLIDWSEPGSDAFYESVAAARKYLSDRIDEMDKNTLVTITCVGHTHIDVAWLWRLKHTREKSARSFSTVMRLMELFPEYIFLQTQPQLYEYIKQDFPEIYEQIQKRVKEGRWEAGGGMWLEADCNLTSGESLTRQLLVGTRFFKEEFGADCEYLWLPDVFGYSWSLPQILRKSGINTFMTTKISWNQYNRMPHDTFKWRGIDGSEVLTHFITTVEPWAVASSTFYTYNGHVEPKTVKGSWRAYRDKELNQELLLSYGYGDGGGGVNREMLEMRRRIDRLPGLPKVKTGRADEYFRRLQETVENTGSYVHTWDGELYLEYHRGTYTSQAYNKRMNRKLELLYREAEWLNVWQSVLGGDWTLYEGKKLTDGWKIILRNQFHDIIPGSSIREVYEDSRLEYAEAEEIGQLVRTQAEQGIASAGESDDPGRKSDSAGVRSFVIWNSSPWQRTDLVDVPLPDSGGSGVWRTMDGRTLNAQWNNGIWTIQVEDLPPLGYTTIVLEMGAGNAILPPTSADTPFQFRENGLSTPFYELEWNGHGQLTRLYDKEQQREVLARGGRGNVLQLFEDKPLNFDAWDIDIFYQEKMREITELTRMEVVEKGPLRAVIHFEWKYGGSVITQDMILYANDQRIDFATEADWHERHQLLKVAFPVHIRSTEATYDIQYGNVKRPTHWNTSWDSARFESVGHQWADLSDRGYGVSLMNDCKYGYDIKDNVLRLSLIKCATSPDIEADQGHHRFTYSLLPHQGDWLQGNTVPSAWALNAPLRFTEGAAHASSLSMFRLSTDTAMVSAVKKAEDSNQVILRVHDYSGSRQPLTITSDLQIVGWRECNLMEVSDEAMRLESELQSVLEPYEIKTFEIDIRTP
ncbi:alpha-mannosidase [Paenibacillus sp. P96]|uniref:Alpha-mannosidase n=1 Tax=Paenibacillus zeirhizosphaerae TaxID=2987519 RepID=A0ABT9FUB0_9BACL|nr:alpha-mannosidase [Paenibacillus sp. P96]MDP4098332.1 alpha-mannosidase [Paenibacillus sp. P96]